MRLSTFVLTCFATAAITASAAAQASSEVQSDPSRARASRAELQASLQGAEALAASTSDAKERDKHSRRAKIIRDRLEMGDSRVGDQVQFWLSNDTTLNGIYTVRTGQMILLPVIGEVPLRGVLHSELDKYLVDRLRKYYTQEPILRTLPLIRLNVSGEVQRPGFHAVPVDAPLTDLLEKAGGQTPRADLEKVTIRRDNEVLYDPKQSSQALTTGLTVDELQLAGGDALVVGARRETNWVSLVQVASTLLGIGLAVYGLTRGRD